MQQIGRKRALYKMGDTLRVGLTLKAAGKKTFVDGETILISSQRSHDYIKSSESSDGCGSRSQSDGSDTQR
jgi:hypothetical protein